MSRIGNAILNLPSGVDVSISKENMVTVKGPKGELMQNMSKGFSIGIEDGVLSVTRPSETKENKSKHGLYRSLIKNMITGVTNGHKREMELQGVGYKASARGQELELVLGYSHKILFVIPAEVKVIAETQKGKNPTIILESMDNQLVGQVAARIRALRKPEPYKGKGIRFVGEVLRKKAGKTAAK